jgi:hypothetical protein
MPTIGITQRRHPSMVFLISVTFSCVVIIYKYTNIPTCPAIIIEIIPSTTDIATIMSLFAFVMDSKDLNKITQPNIIPKII